MASFLKAIAEKRQVAFGLSQLFRHNFVKKEAEMNKEVV